MLETRQHCFREGDGFISNKTIQFADLNRVLGYHVIMNQLGFGFNDKPFRELRRALPEQYAPHKRFALYFQKDMNTKAKSFGLKSAVEDPDNLIRTNNW